MTTQPHELFQTAIGSLWNDNQIVRNVSKFCDECGNRFAGTTSEVVGRDFLVDRFRVIRSSECANRALSICTMGTRPVGRHGPPGPK